MDPFNLRGPEFLAFYVVFATCVLLVAWWWRRSGEARGLSGEDTVAWKRALYGAAKAGAPSQAPDMSDPYLLAYLRGGANEALRVATVALIDRGLIEEVPGDLLAADPRSRQVVSRPIERALLSWFAQPQAASSVFGVDSLVAATIEYAERLASSGLLPDAAARSRRNRLLAGTLALLLGIAAIKVAVALSRGRTNVIFLIMLASITAIVANALIRPRLTVQGAAFLGDVRTLLGGLRARATSIRRGGATAEAALLAGAFGVAALPEDSFPFVRKLFPRSSDSSSSSIAGCGSSCGSSCGGGGGGGGCGGCGGGGD